MSTEHPAAIRFDAVHMVFPNGLRAPVQALRGFDMEVAAGSVVGLLGPNGSGKTTAISCLLGLLQPQSGAVRLSGVRVGVELPRAHRLRAGVLLEDTRLPPFLPVRAALRSVGLIRGLREPGLRAELERVIAETRIEGLLERRVAVLSKGQARRVGLAAALVSDPPLLILDEPSSGLDVGAREEFNVLVRGLRSPARTVLIASHLLSDIESTCTHVAIVKEGQVRLYETAEKLLREARAKDSEKDFHVDAAHAPELDRIQVRYEPSRYPGLVRLLVDEPEHELLGRLVQARVVPARVEPRVNLVSIYLETTGNEPE